MNVRLVLPSLQPRRVCSRAMQVLSCENTATFPYVVSSLNFSILTLAGEVGWARDRSHWVLEAIPGSASHQGLSHTGCHLDIAGWDTPQSFSSPLVPSRQIKEECSISQPCLFLDRHGPFVCLVELSFFKLSDSHCGALHLPRVSSAVHRHWAPKRRIGGSGSSAMPDCWKIQLLQYFSSLIVSFYISLVLVLTLSLLRLIAREVPGRLTPLGRLVQGATAAAPTHIVKAWNVASAYGGPHRVLTEKNKIFNKRSHISPGLGVWKRLWFAILGFSAIPQCVWAAPHGLREVTAIAEVISNAYPESFGVCPNEASLQRLVADLATEHACDRPGPKPQHCVIFQAGFSAHYLLVYAELPCTEDVFVQEAAVLSHDRTQHHQLCATNPQIAEGVATLVAVPRWTRATDKTVFVLDFSHWGGPVYAVLDWAFNNATTLAAAARKHAPEPWQIFHCRSAKPLDSDELVATRPGDVFCFVPVGHNPPVRNELADRVVSVQEWHDAPPFIPREVAQPVWFAIRNHVTRIPIYQGHSRHELQRIAAESFHSDVEDLAFGYPAEDSTLSDLVECGISVRGVLAAETGRTAGFGQDAFVFIDPRLVAFAILPTGWVHKEQLLHLIAERPPEGFTATITEVPCRGSEVQVTNECTVVVSFIADDEVGASLPGHCRHHSLDGFGIDHGRVDRPHTTEPRTFSREQPPSPNPEDVLHLTRPDEEEEQLVNADFIIFVPGFRQELVQILLPIPSDLVHTLHEISATRDSESAIWFDELVPTNPQIDTSFGTLLAVPSWADAVNFVLVDARDIDGRVFAAVFPDRLNRASILLHAQVPDQPGVQVFVQGREIDRDTWHQFWIGDTVTISRAQLVVTAQLRDMLMNSSDWTSPSPTFDGPHFPAFCVLTDGGQQVILVDVNEVRSFADFRRLAIDKLQYTSGSVTITSSQPRVDDLLVFGQRCKAILVASEHTPRLPVPPCRQQFRRNILFLDCRRILKGFHWTSVVGSLIEVELIASPYQQEAPTGLRVNIKGADTEIREGQTFLRISHATLLTLTYVEERDSTADEGDSPSSDAPGEGDNLSDGSSETPASSSTSPEAPKDKSRAGSRSRSPPGDKTCPNSEVCSDLAFSSAKSCAADGHGHLSSSRAVHTLLLRRGVMWTLADAYGIDYFAGPGVVKAAFFRYLQNPE